VPALALCPAFLDDPLWGQALAAIAAGFAGAFSRLTLWNATRTAAITMATLTASSARAQWRSRNGVSFVVVIADSYLGVRRTGQR
jgi:hypothetical protein